MNNVNDSAIDQYRSKDEENISAQNLLLVKIVLGTSLAITAALLTRAGVIYLQMPSTQALIEKETKEINELSDTYAKQIENNKQNAEEQLRYQIKNTTDQLTQKIETTDMKCRDQQAHIRIYEDKLAVVTDQIDYLPQQAADRAEEQKKQWKQQFSKYDAQYQELVKEQEDTHAVLKADIQAAYDAKTKDLEENEES